MHQPRATGVLLIGSVPLSSTAEVFATLTSHLPNRLRSIPDGETGNRCNYVLWQHSCFPTETVQNSITSASTPNPKPHDLTQYTLDDIKPTGYDDAAISSYAKFVQLRKQGSIPPDVRFQVSLPTPMNAIQVFVRPEYQSMIEPLYAQRIFESLTRIIKTIPSHDLTIQWDMAYDVFALENARGNLSDEKFRPHFGGPGAKRGVLERVERLCAVIPREVMLGFHFCYGDYEHKHFLEPADLSVPVELANSIIRMLGIRSMHNVDYIHMPVPKSRDDVAFFAPLRDLRVGGTYLYLGVVHAGDEEGTRRRVAVAGSVLGEVVVFGVATECGLGRTGREEVRGILEISRNVTSEWEAGADYGYHEFVAARL